MIRTTKLSNGLTVITDAMPHLQSAAIGVWVDAGARHETADENGVAHLLEHMAFKGTARRSARAIAEEIEAVGGHLNAYTAREQTAYYARVLSDDVPLALDLLADILLNSTFDEAELERERQVVIQEIGQANDTPDDIIFDWLQETAYPDQGLGRPILGPLDGIAAMPREKLVGFMARHYRAERMVLAAAGGVDHDALCAQAERLFAGLGSGGGPAAEPARYAGGGRIVERDLDQAHVALAFPAFAYHDPDYYALQIYATAMGGGMSSRLFQEVRETRGLAYSVYAFVAPFMDGGLFSIYAGTGGDQVTELLPVLADEMRGSAHRLNAEDIARARAQHKAGVLMALESPSNRIEQIARQFLIYGRVLSLDEIVSRIEAVRPADCARVAGRLLERGAVTLAALGPVGDMGGYDDWARRFAA